MNKFDKLCEATISEGKMDKFFRSDAFLKFVYATSKREIEQRVKDMPSDFLRWVVDNANPKGNSPQALQREYAIAELKARDEYLSDIKGNKEKWRKDLKSK